MDEVNGMPVRPASRRVTGAAFLLGLFLSGALQHFFVHPLFHLHEKGRWFRRVEFDRSLMFTAFQDFRAYLGLVGELWPTGRHLEVASLLDLDKNPRRLEGAVSPARVLAFIGSGTYPQPYPDPYRLPFVRLSGREPLYRLFPSLGRGGWFPSNHWSENPLGEFALMDFPDGKVLLAPGIALRLEQAVRELQTDQIRLPLQVVIWVAFGLFLGWIFRGFLCLPDGSARPRWATGAQGVVVLLVLLLLSFPRFNVTRSWEFDPERIGPEGLKELQVRGHRLLDQLADAGALDRTQLPVLHQWIDHPPVVP